MKKGIATARRQTGNETKKSELALKDVYGFPTCKKTLMRLTIRRRWHVIDAKCISAITHVVARFLAYWTIRFKRFYRYKKQFSIGKFRLDSLELFVI